MFPQAIRAALRLPFDGEWFVMEGGDTWSGNYHVMLHRSFRHAVDFGVWRSGGLYRTEGRTNEDYWCWGLNVLAPADAEVVSATDGAPDNKPRSDFPLTSSNRVMLEVAAGEFVLIAHLQQGSVRVRSGDSVAAGDVLGLCGNSGNSLCPHVHLHAQNAPDVSDGHGLPMVFQNYCADGARTRRGQLRANQFVAAQ
jgi:murein DD-endopeptidase MepM/ murein hydrolase activator NlpD